MTVPEIKRLIEDVTCEDFEILVVPDDNFCFLQVECMEDCVEHRIRESFQYKGERVYGPHFDVDSLHELASQRRLDLRPE